MTHSLQVFIHSYVHFVTVVLTYFNICCTNVWFIIHDLIHHTFIGGVHLFIHSCVHFVPVVVFLNILHLFIIHYSWFNSLFIKGVHPFTRLFCRPSKHILFYITLIYYSFIRWMVYFIIHSLEEFIHSFVYLSP